MMCPKCQQQTLKQKYARELNLTVDCCSRCQGIWFDGDELSQAMPEAERRPEIPRHAVRLKALCPRCDKPLHAFPYPGTRVTVETCGKCGGLWLDAGEFTAIRETRQQLEENPPAEETAEPDGIKGALIRFIDAAIEQLWYW
jgi:Zn-finger nucleic acid-binding protein